jgi:hypothetical protein
VTAPGVKLWGNGKSIFNASVVGDAATPVLSASVQKGLEPTYPAPWSVAAGATWRRPRGAIHATAEWFSSVAAYDILQPEPAPIAGSSETVPLTYGERRRASCAINSASSSTSATARSSTSARPTTSPRKWPNATPLPRKT